MQKCSNHDANNLKVRKQKWHVDLLWKPLRFLLLMKTYNERNSLKIDMLKPGRTEASHKEGIKTNMKYIIIVFIETYFINVGK